MFLKVGGFWYHKKCYHFGFFLVTLVFTAIHFSLLAELKLANHSLFLHTLDFSPSKSDTCLHVIEVAMEQSLGGPMITTKWWEGRSGTHRLKRWRARGQSCRLPWRLHQRHPDWAEGSRGWRQTQGTTSIIFSFPPPPHLLCRWLIIFQHYNHLMPPIKNFNQMKRFVPLIFFPAMAQSKRHTLWPEHKTCRQPAKDTLESVWVRQASGTKPFHLFIFTEFCCCWKGLQLTQRTWRRTAPCLFCSTVKMSSGKSAMPAEMDRLIIDTFPGSQYRL